MSSFDTQYLQLRNKVVDSFPSVRELKDSVLTSTKSAIVGKLHSEVKLFAAAVKALEALPGADWDLEEFEDPARWASELERMPKATKATRLVALDLRLISVDIARLHLSSLSESSDGEKPDPENDPPCIPCEQKSIQCLRRPGMPNGRRCVQCTKGKKGCEFVGSASTSSGKGQATTQGRKRKRDGSPQSASRDPALAAAAATLAVIVSRLPSAHPT